ncbi:uncharacterized protein LACBIDRAFT_319042 [Laccaria bicolor S238N-H82]|uniref:ATPase inhibitor, mitochondrial n=1 Tax=Laccaria bicolor (strain S238N-H82 / ATCC MYA-4686) TaxID=486041 RepID=B0D7Q7_LACBS|nr:uncharacterized protein LACBIDRAFT_319042 [Laccaria bicolor S238N-H82]EDR09691.1 predicted protein [Laccaria bicolor S238N-H82]|eukprot:XP_001880040.1 predicted protein [Laccaria bicolor S238N-H82]
MLAAARISVARRLPTVFVARYTDGRVEGTVAQSKGFSKKEKAHEDEYIHRHEMELLQKMKKQIEARKKELEELQAQANELAGSYKKE